MHANDHHVNANHNEHETHPPDPNPQLWKAIISQHTPWIESSVRPSCEQILVHQDGECRTKDKKPQTDRLPSARQEIETRTFHGSGRSERLTKEGTSADPDEHSSNRNYDNARDPCFQADTYPSFGRRRSIRPPTDLPCAPLLNPVVSQKH